MSHPLVTPALALLLSLAAGPAFPQDGPGTSEFQVNTTTTGYPTGSAVAQARSGGFVVVWTVEEPLAAFPDFAFPIGLFGRRFDPAGRTLGGEFLISSSVSYSSYTPAAAMDDGGSFVVVWNDSVLGSVRASRFAADGTALAEETQLSGPATYAAVAGDAEGNWLVLWNSDDQVESRRFDAAAEVWEPETPISLGTGDWLGEPAVAGNGRGDLVAVWLQGTSPPPTAQAAVMARRLASTGEIRGEVLQIDEPYPGFLPPAVDVDEEGGFVVAWSRDGGVVARRFDAAGMPLGGELQVTTQAQANTGPALTLDAAGELLVAWLGPEPADQRLPHPLMGRRFDSLGVPRGGEFPLTFRLTDSLAPPGLAASAPENNLVVIFRAGHELYGRLLPASLRTGVVQLGDDPDAPFSEVAEEHATRDVRVLRTGGNGPLTVEYTTADGAVSLPGAPAATAGEDYAAASGTLAFADDEFVKTFPLEIFEDDARESNELLTVEVHHPTGGALLGEPAVAEVVIYDDDPVVPGEGPAPRGPELRVNGSRAGEQRYPRVAADADGDFLVVWQGRNGDDWDVFGRLFGADGAARGPQLSLADETAGDQMRPAVAAAPDGSFVVSWIQDRATVHGRRVTPSGATPSLGAELPLGVCSSYCTVLATDVAVDGTGRFVVVWNGGFDYEPASHAPPPYVEGRRFSARGEPLGEKFHADAGAGPAAVSTAPSGEFIVVWSDSSGTLIGHRKDADGVEVGSFTLDGVPGASHPDLVRLPGSDVLAYWQGVEPAADPGGSLVSSKSLDVYGRRFSSRGAPRGERFLLNGFRAGVQSEPRVAASATGEHVVVYTSRDELGPGRSDVLARRFAGDGRILGARMPVNPSPRPKSSPDVAMDAAGDYVVVWESEAADGDFDVFAQRFSGAACVAGPHALCLRDGRFRVEVDWRNFAGARGRGFARPLTEDTGVFWFFGEDNLEVMVKVLDGRALNGHFWVFYGSLSNVGFEIAVTDAVSGRRRTYVNPLGHFASAGDTQAFAGEP